VNPAGDKAWRPQITEATARRRARMARAQDGMCPACGQPLPDDLADTEVDHIIPRSRGGPSDAWNKRLVHFMCNRSKGFKLTPEAEALAKEHGIALHLPVPASATAYRPLTLDQSLWEGYLRTMFYGTPEEHEAARRRYLDKP
jgi:5-methylcytosine-specific restriction endonuclease McrA